MRLTFKDTVEPNTTSEIVLKVAAYLSGLDVAASLFYTWDDCPAYHRTARSEGDIRIVAYAPKHHRLTVFGLEFSRSWSDFVFRGETAYFLGKYPETEDIAIDPIQKDLLKQLVGVDWNPGNDWTLIVRFTGDDVIDHDTRLADDMHEYMATFIVSRKLLNQTLILSNAFYYPFGKNEIYTRPCGICIDRLVASFRGRRYLLGR
jgi:hypothetical protein